MGLPRLFNIPAGFSFADVLAKGLLGDAGDDPMEMARMQVLLPTRRACRTLREAFLRWNDSPILLPKLNPIGDVDEDEMVFSMVGEPDELSLPPACPPLRRKFLLAKEIAEQGRGRNIEQNLALADALGRLMDQIHTENLDMKDLPHIVDKAEFANHWQISLDFLTILSERWPRILKERGLIDAADRRNKLLNALADHWEKTRPTHKIIAAGSTGSIPATARLLNVIARLPNGCVVLPGLDQAMEEESWNHLDDTHPQKTLHHLLGDVFGVERKDVTIWPAIDKTDYSKKDRRAFAREIMRPSQTVEAWQDLKKTAPFAEQAFPIERYDCAHPQEEALVIALAMRQTLETKGQRAALVTPDRKLAARVAATCRRWGIEIDDSGGMTLGHTPAGVYIRLAAEAAAYQIKPVALLDFCKHALCQPPMAEHWRSHIRAFDRNLCRGPAFEGGGAAYKRKLNEYEDRKGPQRYLADTISKIETGFAPLLSLAEQKIPLRAWIDAHLRVCEFFCDPGFLWRGQEGESASVLFSTLTEEADILPPLALEDYLQIITEAMNGITVRPSFGLHPRLMILGQLEARLVEADVMILGGLNEGTWPPKISPDPWMSRPMRKRFGLPPHERGIGLSAHDFAQSLCADKVILTRSLRVDGAPGIPSRWLQRMDTVLKASGATLANGSLLRYAQVMDQADTVTPFRRPEPRPPVSARPRKLSVTKIDQWISDPYGIYARYILDLKKLDPLEQPLDARTRGNILHKALENFVKAHPGDLPENVADTFVSFARAEMDRAMIEPHIRILWEPRIARAAAWMAAQETDWREGWKCAAQEIEGQKTFTAKGGDFTLTTKVDRIDCSKDGQEAAIIDYKSGGTFSKTGMQDGRHTQLPLEAVILEEGGFKNLKPAPVTALSYWVVNGGGEDGGKETILSAEKEITAAKTNARAGLCDLIDVFDDEQTPYYSLPRSDRRPRFNDYEHLARVKEWTSLDDQEEEHGS